MIDYCILILYLNFQLRVFLFEYFYLNSNTLTKNTDIQYKLYRIQFIASTNKIKSIKRFYKKI